MLFDLNKIETGEEKTSVLVEKDEYKTRIIELSQGESIPDCKMNMHVLFIVLKGEVVISLDGVEHKVSQGQALITENTTVNMKTDQGVKILGIQIQN
ncbi:MAG: hypothetical protein KGY75_08180 [Candidatus Cloacimonetes bacterium]|nr:hypothetical protein [Candidatus Cloacimonadota bacterium]MBS3768079.1 hypothetical protein [Candidatus Cloacimonadota bacterium]